MSCYDLVRKNIRKYRKKQNITQEQLADDTDLSVDYLREIESLTKNKTFSLKVVNRIAKSLNIELYELFK